MVDIERSRNSILQTGSNTDSGKSRTLHFAAGNEQSRQELRHVINSINPLAFCLTVESARRIARIYALTDLSIIPSDAVIQEAGYLEHPVFDNDSVKSSLRTIHQVHLAVDPLIQAHTTSAHTRLERMVDYGDILYYARHKAMYALNWWWDVKYTIRQFNNDLTTSEVEDWRRLQSYGLPKLISSSLKYLPELAFKKFQYTVSLDELENLVTDTGTTSPEFVVIQKEELSALIQAMSSLSEANRKVIFHLATYLNEVGEDQKHSARIELAQRLERQDLLNRSYHEETYQAPDSFLGMTDNQGYSIFYGLELGQVYWLVTRLASDARLTVFHKFGYIDPGSSAEVCANRHNLTYRQFDRLRKHAKREIMSHRAQMEDSQIPILESSIKPHLDSAAAYEPLRYANGKEIPRNSRARFDIVRILETRQDIFNSLSPQRQAVARHTLEGLTTDEIAAALNMTAVTVAAHISDIARISRKLSA